METNKPLSSKRICITNPRQLGKRGRPIIMLPIGDVKEAVERLKSPKHTLKSARAEDDSRMVLISYNEIDEIMGRFE